MQVVSPCRRRGFGVALAALLIFAAVPTFAGTHRPRIRPKQVGGPTMAFEENAVIASGVPAGTNVYFASVSLIVVNEMLTVQRQAGVAAAAAGGQARYGPTSPVLARSVWIGVDGATGGYTVGAPIGTLLREVDFPGNGLGSGPGGALRRVVIERDAVEVFLIRPGTGVWVSLVSDGVVDDADGERNGKATLDIGSMQTMVGTTAPPEKIEQGDIVFVVDPISLEFFVTRRGN